MEFRVGYALHIHRADEWHDSHRHPIALAEWRAVVAADPDLRPDPHGDPHIAWWPAGSGRHPGGTRFVWCDGLVRAKNPDRPAVAKMLELARTLGAHVQTDDGEFIDRPEDMLTSAEVTADEPPSRPVPVVDLAGCAVAGAGVLAVFAVGLVTIIRLLVQLVC